MNQDFDSSNLGSDVKEIFSEATDSFEYPSSVDSFLANLGNPERPSGVSPPKRLNPHSQVRQRNLFLVAAASVILFLGASLWFINKINNVQNVEVAAPDTTRPKEEVQVDTVINPNDPLDDPNPAFDGLNGRAPVTENPIPKGYPTPVSTGYKVSQDSLEQSESITVTQDGAVVEGMDVDGGIVIKANNVTIRNSRFTSAGTYVVELESGFNNLTIEDTRIRGVGEKTSAAVYLRGSARLNAVHITGGINNVKTTAGNVSLSDSYLSAPYIRAGNAGRNVIFQSGSNYTFSNNTMLAPYRLNGAAILMQARTSDISDVRIDGNYFSGGRDTIFRSPGDFDFRNIVVDGNQIEKNSWVNNWRTDNVEKSSGFIFIDNTQVVS